VFFWVWVEVAGCIYEDGEGVADCNDIEQLFFRKLLTVEGLQTVNTSLARPA
jgi:hypothetical protein